MCSENLPSFMLASGHIVVFTASSARPRSQATLKHFAEEESDFLTKLGSLVGTEKLMEMGQQFQSAKAHAPTRPHPSEPNKPPLNVAAHITATPIDMAADAIRFGGAPPS